MIGINLPGFNPGGQAQTQAPNVTPVSEQPNQAAYKIPPAVWMIVFLIGGYLGLRWVMED